MYVCMCLLSSLELSRHVFVVGIVNVVGIVIKVIGESLLKGVNRVGGRAAMEHVVPVAVALKIPDFDTVLYEWIHALFAPIAAGAVAWLGLRAINRIVVDDLKGSGAGFYPPDHLIVNVRIDVGDGLDHGLDHGLNDLLRRCDRHGGIGNGGSVNRDGATTPANVLCEVVLFGAVALVSSVVAALFEGTCRNILETGHAGRLDRLGALAGLTSVDDQLLLLLLLLQLLLLLLLLLLLGPLKGLPHCDLRALGVVPVPQNIAVRGTVDLGAEAIVGSRLGAVDTVVEDVAGRHVSRWHGAEGAHNSSVKWNAFGADHLAYGHVHVHFHEVPLLWLWLLVSVATKERSAVLVGPAASDSKRCEKECSDGRTGGDHCLGSFFGCCVVVW